MRSMRKGFARFAVLLLVAAGAVGTAGVGTANASDPIGVVMATTQRMSGPSLTTHQYGTYARGTRVSLTCWVRGQAVFGYFGGPDSLWYQTPGGYVADIDLETYTSLPVGRACTTSSAPSASTKAARAVAWAQSQVGSQAYVYACETFVENAYGTSRRYLTALAAFQSIRASGTMHYTSTNIPAGSLVFSDGPLDGPNGHVMLSIGGGRFVSGGANGPSVKIFTTPNPGSTFLGWAPAPSSWPGR